jgi:hypothetical protein
MRLEAWADAGSLHWRGSANASPTLSFWKLHAAAGGCINTHDALYCYHTVHVTRIQYTLILGLAFPKDVTTVKRIEKL